MNGSPWGGELGRVLVTGASGFVGSHLVRDLRWHGHEVRAFDRVPPTQPNGDGDVVIGDICDPESVAAALEAIDTVFHTAAVIDLLGGKAASARYRERSYAVNVVGTQNLVRAAQAGGAARFIYTSSNSVVMGGRPIRAGNESLPYTTRFADLYTETKVAAEKFVLDNNGVGGMYTCAIRPSSIWGPGDQTMFPKMFEAAQAGQLKFVIGDGSARLDNTYIANLVFGFLLAAQHCHPGGAAAGQAYFINDDEPVNMFDFARPVLEACGYTWPRRRLPAALVRWLMIVWQRMHFTFGLPAPAMEPLAVERVTVDNYFSIDKAARELGYCPVVTTEQALRESMPYYLRHEAEMRSTGSSRADRSVPVRT